MFIGLLIGLTVWGAMVSYVNAEATHTGGQVVRMIAHFCFVVGFCGSVGWFVGA